MKKKALRKDFFVEVKRTYSRFLSIFLITALGVAFFSGVRASEPDMELSADRFYDENHYMDVRVLSTLGLEDADVNALQAVTGVKTVEPSYSMDVLSYRDDGVYTLKVFSLTEELNQITPIEGRLPEMSGECILDRGLAEYGYQIGDKIMLQSGTDDDLADSFHTTTYTVVGMGITPAYISVERESSQIGRGYVDGFAAVLPEDFSMDVYTEIYLTVDGAQELVSYRDAYDDLVDAVVANIEEIQSERESVRYASILSEADEKIADAEKELADGKAEAETELADAYKKLQDAKQELEDGRQELEDAKAKISDGRAEIAENKQKLTDAQKELDDGVAQYTAGKAEYEASKKEFDAQLASGSSELAAAKQELEANEAELEIKQQEMSDVLAAFEKQQAELEEQERAFAVAKEAGLLDEETMLATEQELTAAREQIDAYEIQLSYEQELLVGVQEKLFDVRTEIEDSEEELEEGKAALEAAKAQLDATKQQLDEAQNEINRGWREIADAEAELSEGEKKISENEQALKDGEKELNENEITYWEEKAKADKEIADAEKELADAKRELADLKMPEWYVLTRNQSQTYAEYGQNAERIGALGKVFPVFFFLIAALVCLTTMTRMVEEQRTQIGTLKALGYGKWAIAAKYLLYAGLASFMGGVFGALAGQKIFPLVIVSAYQMMYSNLPYCLIPYNVWYSVSAIGVMMACTVLAAYAACAKEMHTNAAELMRPEAPKNGKRVLLERIGFVWKRLSFGQKASVRNLFRYKKRFFMTIIGIGGCMALMLVGFGIRDSIYDIAKLQYEELFHYTGTIVRNGDADVKENAELLDFLNAHQNVACYLAAYQTSVDLTIGETEKSAYLICPQQIEGFSDYVLFRDRVSKETYELPDDADGIVLTEKVADMLGVSVGDTITIQLDDTTGADARVLYLTENYAMHYVYLTPQVYESLFGAQPDSNVLFYRAFDDSDAARDAFAEQILDLEAVSEVQSNKETKASIDDMLEILDLVVWVLIFSAGLLAFVVLYNLNNINITERQRELATLRVLGFYNKEVGAYVYRESVMLTVIGIIVGCFLGFALHRYVIFTVEIDMLMFGRDINWKSYVYGALLTVFFSALINWVMYFKLKKIDMVESLKSIE